MPKKLPDIKIVNPNAGPITVTRTDLFTDFTLESTINKPLLPNGETVNPGSFGGYILPSPFPSNPPRELAHLHYTRRCRREDLPDGFTPLDLQTYFQVLRRWYHLKDFDVSNSLLSNMFPTIIETIRRDDLRKDITDGLSLSTTIYSPPKDEIKESDLCQVDSELFFTKLIAESIPATSLQRQPTVYETSVVSDYFGLLLSLFGDGFVYAGRIFQYVYGAVYDAVYDAHLVDASSGSQMVYLPVRLMFKLSKEPCPVNIHLSNNPQEIIISSGLRTSDNFLIRGGRYE